MLVGVEAELHKASYYDGALDEVAMVDTAAEIIGSAVALDDLGLFDSKIYSTPVAVGGRDIQNLSRHSLKLLRQHWLYLNRRIIRFWVVL